MRYITYVLCVLMSANLETLANKKCPDCMNIMKCDLAVKSVDDVNKIREAFCGFNDLGTMVCCSYFSVSEIEIENHPNVDLLPQICGVNRLERIIGGLTVSLYEYPWMALISFQSGTGAAFPCAGSVINSRYILTAAHCIKDKNISSVRIGEFNLTSDVDCQEDYTGKKICESYVQDILVEEKIYHEKYEGYPGYNHDIGLLRLASPIDFSYKNAAPICLPTTKKLYNNSLTHKLATITGWGLSDTFNTPSVLRKSFVHIYPDDECSLFNRDTPERRLNYGFDKYCGRTDEDACNRDSGTPLLMNVLFINNFKYIQYGIMSSGPSDCRQKSLTMFTAVPPHMSWILDHIKE